tara:strand:- start:284 stop:469 length:186 start_codon:yes stop_codon:yes gene_type:complete
VNPLLNPAMANGGHGINLIIKPPELQMTPVRIRRHMAELRFKSNPLKKVLQYGLSQQDTAH